MMKQIDIHSFKDVQKVVAAAAVCLDDIGVHDARGAIADAKSILGLMSLDYSAPVHVVSENERELEHVVRALHQN